MSRENNGVFFFFLFLFCQSNRALYRAIRYCGGAVPGCEAERCGKTTGVGGRSGHQRRASEMNTHVIFAGDAH